MSNSDNMQLAYAQESSFGVAVTGPFNVLRFTSESLKQNTSTTRSAEVRPDRQVGDITRNSVNAGGGVNFELSAQSQDDMLKAALMADSGWSTLPSKTAITIAAANTGNKLTDSGNGFVTAGFVSGQRVTISGFTGAGTTANGTFTLGTVAAGEIVLIGATLVDDAAGESVTIQVVTPRITAATISAAAGDNSLNDSGNGFLTAGFAANQWVKVSGFTGASTTANGYFKIVTAAAGKLVVSGATLIDDAAGESVTILAGESIVNGTTMPSFNLEKKFSDLASELAVLKGMAVDQMSLNVTAEAIITGSLSFMGKNEVSLAASTGNAYAAAPTTDVMNAVDHVLHIIEGGAGSDFDARAFSLQLANNLRTRLEIGEVGISSLGKGKCIVTGKLQAYYTTKAIMDKYLAMTASSLAVVVKDTAGNAYIVDLPRLRYTDGQRVAGGENQDIVADMSWSACMHPTEGITARIVRFRV